MRLAFRVRDWSLFGAGLLLGVLGASVLFGPPQMANETPPWDRPAQDGAATATHAAGAGPAMPIVSPPAAVFGPPAAPAPVAAASAPVVPAAPVMPAPVAPAQAAASQPVAAPALALAPAASPPSAAASEPAAAKPETVAKAKPRHHEVEKHETESQDALPPPEWVMQVNPDEARATPQADEAATSDSFATIEPKPRHHREHEAAPDDAATSDAARVVPEAPPRFAPEAPARGYTDSSPPAAATGEATGDAHAPDASQ